MGRIKIENETSALFSITANRFRTFIIAAFLLTLGISNSFATSYYSRVTGNWGAGASWSTASCGGAECLCEPGASSDVVTICSGYTITLAATVIQTGAITISGGTLSIPSGYTLTCTSLTMTSGTLTVNGTLTVGAGGTGAFTISGGTFTAPGTGSATGTVVLSSTSAQTITGTSGGTINFYNLTVAGLGAKTLSASPATSVLVYHTLTQTGSATLAVGSNTLTVGTGLNGTGITQAQAFITTTSSSNLSFGGGTYNITLGSSLTNTWPVTLASFTMTSDLATITLGTSQSLTVSGAFNLSAGGNFKIGANTLTLNGAVTMSGSCYCNQITGGSTSNITIGGSGAASFYFDLTTTTAGGTNTIATFTNTRTSNSIVLEDNLRIGTSLTQSSSSSSVTIDGSSISATFTIDGSLSGSGTFIGSSTLAYMVINGSGALGANLTFSSVLSLAGLQINRSSGSVVLGSNLAVAGNVTMTQGTLDINNKTLDLGTTGDVTSETSANRIFCSTCTSTTGKVTSSGNSLAANTTYTGIRGLGLDITTGTTAPGTTTINRGFGAESGGALSSSILRWYEITPTTNSGLNATLNIKYWTTELNSLTEANLQLFNTAIGTSSWVDQAGTVNTSTHAISLSGINSFTEWTAGAPSCTTPSTPVVTISNNCGNSVLSTTATGTLLWSSGATTSSITVTNIAAYSVTTTVSGCTSAAGSNASAPLTVPSTPSVTPVNNCGNSVLSTTATGALLWTGGATTSAITVTSPGTYSVTQTAGNGCTSTSGSGVAAPLSVPSAPSVSVADACGSSVLSTAATGSLLWSTGSTASSITVTAAGPYSVTTTVNGCASPPGFNTASPVSTPSAPTGASSLSLCTAATVADLFAAGSNIQWYAAYSGGDALSSSTALSDGTTYYASQTVNGCESTSRFAVTVSVTSCVPFTVKFFLQGYYIGEGKMSPLLKLLGFSANATDVDLATIELHAASDPSTVAYSYTGILQSNDSLLCNFDSSATGNSFYIVIKHRNGLETWSATAVTIDSLGLYDFTTGAGQAYNNNEVNLGSGIYGIYSGDVNQDGSINSTDQTTVQTGQSTFLIGVYDVKDVTGDGFVDEDDYRVVKNNATLGITVQHP